MLNSATTVVALGKQLQARRKALKKTQAEIGAETGLRQEVLSRLERGRLADFSVSKLLRLVQALDLEITLTPSGIRQPTLETLLAERQTGANTGPDAR